MATHDLTGFQPALVLLSVIITLTASYTSLDLAARICPAQNVMRRAWLFAAALVLGAGIWSMHFVGMLASLPMPMAYNVWWTLGSFVVAVAGAGAGFYVASLPGRHAPWLIAGSLVGLGIVAAHLLGLMAMRVPQWHLGESGPLAMGVALAMAASLLAIRLAFRRKSGSRRVLAAIVLALGIAGLHYLCVHDLDVSDMTSAPAASLPDVIDTGHLIAVVGASTLLILFVGALALLYDRRVGELAERQVRAEQQSEERFRRLYRRTPLPLHSLDSDGRIQQVSQAWLALLGYDEGEVVGRPLTDFMTEASARRRRDEHWPTLLDTGELRDAEYTLQARDGREIECLLSAVAERDEQGRVVSTVCGLVDISQRRRAEAALRQAQKLEAVGQLTGGIAHDFNNLLAVIVGNLELARRRVPEGDRLWMLIDNTMQAAQRGAALTQRMLAFARRQDLKSEPVDVPELVLGMADLLRRSIGPSVKIETRFPLGLPRALVDGNQLELALLNLAVNARDAMPQGGTVVISASEQPGEGGREPMLCLDVTDSGVGMDEATLARAAEPFFTTKGVGKGTGLGLAMVHGLAAQSGGRLQLSSRPGQGTTASICLPVATGASAAEPAPSRTAPELQGPSAGGVRVLVVDDDPLVLSATAAMVEDLGYGVVEASSGAEALALFEAGERFDLVLTDHAMPGMTGVQMAERIRERFPSLPIILGTGYAQLPDGVRWDLPRLSKPFGQDTLAQALRQALARASGEAAGNVVPIASAKG